MEITKERIKDLRDLKKEYYEIIDMPVSNIEGHIKMLNSQFSDILMIIEMQK